MTQGTRTPRTYAREDLIAICERAIVPFARWSGRNRDTADAQRQLGECWALLKAGCPFRIEAYAQAGMILVYIDFPEEVGAKPQKEQLKYQRYYLPTVGRLETMAGLDWC